MPSRRRRSSPPPAAPPSAPKSKDERPFIGLEKEDPKQQRVFLQVYDRPGGKVWGTIPAYRDGDEWNPLGSPGVIPRIQMQLVASGLLSQNKVRPGIWDTSSAAAYRKVLEMANRNDVDAATMLRFLADNPDIGTMEELSGGGGGGRVLRRTNPIDIQAVANEVAPRVIGRRLKDDELSRLVAAYQAVENNPDAPALDAATQAFARETDPTQATVRDLTGVFDTALKLMGA